MKQNTAIFANFVVHFGPKKSLLDYVEEVVVRAFTDDVLHRKYASTTYHLHKVKLWNFAENGGPPELAIAGQFVKDTLLKREQVYDSDQDQLVPDEAGLSSAPSAYFVLALKNHRLAYFAETSFCPRLSEFKGTLQKFLRMKHGQFVRSLRSAATEKTTLTSLFQQHPEPTLDIVPFVGGDNLSEFIGRFSILKKIDFRLVQPNPEIDGGDIFAQIRQLREGVGADAARVTVSNTDGLDSQASAKLVADASISGNEEIRLDGLDMQGNKLTGNNEEFQLQAAIPDPPATKRALAKRLYGLLDKFEDTGEISSYRGSPEEAEKLEHLARLFR